MFKEGDPDHGAQAALNSQAQVILRPSYADHEWTPLPTILPSVFFLFHSDLPKFNLKLAAGVHTESHGSGNLEQELGDRLLRLCWPMDSSEVESQQG